MNYVTKKNIVLIVIAALFVTGVFFITEYRNKNAQQAIYLANNSDIIATSTAFSEEEISANKIDSDSDALHDWEEVLWGTDSKNPDSDADGTSDGAEVAAGRNPLTKKTSLIDDSFAALAKKASATASASKETLTLTDEFGRDVFAKYIELRQNGGARNVDEQQQLIYGLLSDPKYGVSPKAYTDKDLIVKIDASPEALRTYSSRIIHNFKSNIVNARDEGVIVKESLTLENPEILKELDPIIASYKAMLQQLIATPAPQPLYENHKKLVNTLSTLVFITETFRKADVDPVLTLQGAARLQQATADLDTQLRAIKSYVENAGVPFNI